MTRSPRSSKQVGRTSVASASVRWLIPLLALHALGGCTRFTLLDATIPGRGYLRTTDIVYGPEPRQKLDVYRPKNAVQPAGIVVFFYGGDWQTGSKRDYRFVAQALVSEGFVAVLPDYRLYPKVTFPAFVEDGALAVRWAQEHAVQIEGDPKRIYLMGHSAGAHIATMLTLDPHFLKDVGLDRNMILGTAALSGPFDFVPPSYDRGVFDMAAGQEKPDPITQPITFADGTAPPILLIHGMKDETVSYKNSVELADRIHEKGGRADLILYKDKGHVAVVLALAKPFRKLAPTLADVTKFFREAARSATASIPNR